LDLFAYISQNQSSPSIKDNIYDKIFDHLDKFIKNMPEKDKQLLIQTVSKCYLKYQKSIKANGNSDFELIMRLLMAILLDQQLQIDKLIK
jgi:hypothetical protein